jgi:cytochrome c biogenesis protein CcdA
MVTYAALGVLLISSVLSVPALANFLQKYMNKILAPVLILTGLFLLDVLRLNISGLMVSQEKQESLANSGIKGTFILGIIFALAFCPVSAALFFGSLIPLSLSNKFGITFPFIYGIATGLPVLAFALFIAFGIKSVSKWFSKVTKFEIYARKITGAIFILVGAYYILAHIFYLL